MTMVLDFVLEKAFEALYEGVKEVIGNNLKYSDLFKEIKETLECLAPLIKEMGQYNQQLKHTKVLEGLEALMKQGMELVEKCSKIRKGRFNSIYNKHSYSKEIEEFKASLSNKLQLLNVQMVTDVTKTGVAVEGIEVTVQLIHEGVSTLLQTKKNEDDEEIEAISSSPLPQLPELIVGLEVPLEELKKMLLNSNGSMPIIVTAPAGCGKTTLAAKICQDQDVKDKFQENIFFVEVTKKPSLERIMKALYVQKGYNKRRMSQIEATPVKWLEKVAMEKGDDPLLLVLDDVWPGSESLLEKFQFKMANYKILVTSRSEFPKFGSSYHLQLLEYDDALQLFHDAASSGDKTSHIPQHLSNEIVKYCKGFPSTIVEAGRSLCGHPEHIWRSRADEWSESSNVLDFETDVFLSLQTRMDVLDNSHRNVEKCFFDLAAFLGDAEIPVTTLFDMWAELYGMQNEKSCIGLLTELNNRGLAFLRQSEGETDLGVVQEAVDYSECVVKQLESVRKLAIYNLKRQAVEDRERLIIHIRGNNFPKWWSEQKYQHINARLVSISTDGEFSAAKWPNINFPKAEVLVLNLNTDSAYDIPEFVERMHELKMLVIVNHSGAYVDLDNFELLSSLSSLRSLRLEGFRFYCITNKKSRVPLKNVNKLHMKVLQWANNVSGDYDWTYVFPSLKEIVIEALGFSEFPAGICELVRLTKLKFTCLTCSDHRICSCALELPVAMGNMVNLEVLKLDHFYGLPDSIGKLKKLKLLIMKRLSGLPESIGSLVSLQVLRLENCRELEHIPDSLGNLKKLKLLKISDNKEFQFLPETIGELKSLRHLVLDSCKKLYELPESIGKLVNIEILSVRHCYILSGLPKSVINLRKLNFLDIEACCKLEELPEHFGELKSLRKLQMTSCGSLKELPPSVSDLVHLKEVVGDDWQVRRLWTTFLPILKDLNIVVWKPKRDE